MSETPTRVHTEHAHGRIRHAHAFAYVPHNHMLRALCSRPECQGAVAHNVHASVSSDAQS